jgi:hypothetical protein
VDKLCDLLFVAAATGAESCADTGTDGGIRQSSCQGPDLSRRVDRWQLGREHHRCNLRSGPCGRH